MSCRMDKAIRARSSDVPQISFRDALEHVGEGGKFNGNNLKAKQILKINMRQNNFTGQTLFCSAIQHGMAQEPAAPFPMEWKRMPCWQDGTRLASVAPLSMGQHCSLRHHGAWRGTYIELHPPACPGLGQSIQAFPPSHRREQGGFSLPLLILPPKSLKIEGFLHGFRAHQVS
jgi:hypothetical protein